MAHTAIGTIGGTLLVLISIPVSTILSTVILAMIGASISYATTLFLKWLRDEYLIWKRKKKENENINTKV